MQDKPDTYMEYTYKCRLCNHQFSPLLTRLNVTQALAVFTQLESVPAIWRDGVVIKNIEYHHCRDNDAIGLADLIGVREVLKLCKN